MQMNEDGGQYIYFLDIKSLCDADCRLARMDPVANSNDNNTNKNTDNNNKDSNNNNNNL